MSAASEEITCPACLEVFRDPVSLACNHNLCLQCAKSLSGPAGVITCLLCHEPTETGFKDLPSNKAKGELIERLRDPNGAMADRSCDNCDDVATLQCVQCHSGFCQACFDRIHATGKWAAHTVDDKLSLERCHDHGKRLRFFCQKCSVTVCSDCLLLEAHKTHKYCALEEAAENKRLELKSYQAQVDGQKRRLLAQIQNLTRMQEQLYNQSEAAKKDIITQVAALQQQLSKRKNVLLDQVNEFATNGQRSIEEQRKVVFTAVSTFNLVGMQLDSTSRNPRPNDLLGAYGTELINNFKAAQKIEQPTAPPTVLTPGLEIKDAAAVKQSLEGLGCITLTDLPKLGKTSSPSRAAGSLRISGSQKRAKRLQVGAKIDASDTKDNWYHARVLAIKGDQVTVHFGAQDRGWNENLPLNSKRIAPYRNRVPQCSKACGNCV